MLTIALVAVALLVLNWVGYPLAMAVAARGGGRGGRGGRRRAAAAPTSELPAVAVIIATRDAPEIVLRRVADIREALFPAARLDVIVAVDARSAYGVAEHGRLLAGRAQVVPGDAPGGKAAALNAAVRAATADTLVFADSYQRFAPDAIARLVGFLDDRRYGAVSGAVVHEGHRVMDLYWEYEMLIRRGQSALHSIVSTAGGIQAMRRALWTPLPADLICDDLYITMQIIRQGQRVGFSDAARAMDPRRFTDEQHFRRRVRTLTGLFQFITWMPAVLVPWKNPIWIHFVCHKLMRFVTPYLAILAAVGIGVALVQAAGTFLWLALGVAAVLGALGAALYPAKVKRAGTQVGWLLLLLTAPIVATFNGLRKRWHVWQYHEPVRQG